MPFSHRNSLGWISHHTLRIFVVAITCWCLHSDIGAQSVQRNDRYELNLVIDSTEHPDSEKWLIKAGETMKEWYPRLVNLMLTPEFKAPLEVRLKIKHSDQGVAHAAGNEITVFSGWIAKQPDDIGLAVHELVHIIQHYPPGFPGWITEGIADYLRWAIYEGRPLHTFPLGNHQTNPRPWEQAYQVTAGFFLWLESDRAPGIVSALNRAGRKGESWEDVFKNHAKAEVKDLWKDYVQFRESTPRRRQRGDR